MASTANAQLGRELAAIVGGDYVCEAPAPLTAYAIDGVRPGAWVMPGSAEEISAILRLANELNCSVVATGGFTEQSRGDTPASVDILLRTDRLNRVLHFDPGDLTIGVEAGCRVAEVQRTVGEERLLLPLDVARAKEATIGGALATASYGPLKHGFGGAREYCIGLTFVTGDGRVAKAGGRVVKNVAGYDVMKLMIGSQGTLGVIVSANFKLFPAPRQTRTFLAEFAQLGEALEFRNFVTRSPLSPLCLELISPRAHTYLGSSKECWSVAIRAGGSDPVLDRYRRELGGSVSRESSGTDEAQFWQALQDFAESVRKQHHNAMMISLHMSPSSIGAVVVAAENAALDHNFLFSCVGRVGMASLAVAFVPIAVDPPAAMQYANAISALRKAMSRDGAAIVTHCPREAKAYLSMWGDSSNDLEAMRAVKLALDPKGVLNRGRFLF